MFFQLSLALNFLKATITLAQKCPAPQLEPLQWDVFIIPAVPLANLSGSPTAFTLIHGPNSAILIDNPISIDGTNAIADWIEEKIGPYKRLTHVYVTHGHGDHFYGIPVLQQRFPGVQPIATADVIAHVAEAIQPPLLEDFWGSLFPGQIPAQTENFTQLPDSGEFELDGHVLRAVEVSQADTYNSTVLHVPDLDLVITGDVVYGECFPYLQESNTPELRALWKQAIDEVASLNPTNVVPSHMQDCEGFGVNHLEATRRYLDVWDLEVTRATDKENLKARMRAAFPRRIGEFILELGAGAAFPTAA
ncbi:hypothetical protein IFR05_001264 [Cadophora sp. M221]|nr:hypothetical protein IFR05_001264 [Cadophora sp. M221]